MEYSRRHIWSAILLSCFVFWVILIASAIA